MHKALALTLLLAGCASGPVDAPKPYKPVNVVKVFDMARDQGYAEGREQVLQELRDHSALSVSSWALGDCDSRDAWLPPKGAISDIVYMRAIRREQWAKDRCISRHHEATESLKAILGLIRNYR